MDFKEIRELRQKQYIHLNMQSILFFMIAGILIRLFEPTFFSVWLLIIAVNAVSCLFTWLDIGGKEWRKSEWSRKLVAYEKEKLGSEWFKSKRSELTSKLILIVLFGFQLVLGNASDPFMPSFIRAEFLLSFLLVLIVLTNTLLYFRNRKIDQLSTEKLQGFTKRENTKGIMIGIVFTLIIMVPSFN